MADPTGQDEIMVLDHKPVPGYRRALIVAVILGAVYLVLVFAGIFH